MTAGIKTPDPHPSKQEQEADERFARIARRHGMSNALRLFEEARREGVGPATAAAFIEKESHGRNVVGHDRDRNGRLIFPAREGEVRVTKTLYREYLHRRGPKGAGGMQGIGPGQLTYYTLQDEADREGGCWHPRYNLRVALRQMRRLIAEHGLEAGIARYNGTGPDAAAYARDVLKRREVWQHRLGID